MARLDNTKSIKRPRLREFGLVLLCLVGILAFLFRNGLKPGHTVFSNDGPLGAISAECGDPLERLTGAWQDLNWLGSAAPSAVPDVSTALGIAAGRLWFSKLYAPFSLLFVGLSAWFCFRQWKFTPLACILGGLAVALNGDFLPTTCWGVCAQPIGFGFSYLALGALADITSPRRWVRVALAGFAVGMSVMEAYDIGALFSLAVASFVVFQAFASDGNAVRKAAIGFTRLAVVALFAAFIATAALSTLIGTQIKGIVGMSQDEGTKEHRWDEATMWSLAKSEALGVVVPGLFGLRMDTPDGGAYWGKGGRHPAWDRYFASGKQGAPPQAPLRFGGGSGYAGALVIVVALWAVAQSFRKQRSIFSLLHRRMIWFWLGTVVLTLLFAFGRFAPFYQFFYALPYASTIRNPAKFFHVFQWALLILFAFGADGLSRSFLQPTGPAGRDWASQWKIWWASASRFDRNWIKSSGLVLVAGVLAWWIYASFRNKLVVHLQEVGFDDPAVAGQLASFSVRHVGWAVLLFAIAFALVALILSGCFNGRRARAGGIVLGLFLVGDLAIFAGPWINTYNWKEKFQSSPLIELLHQRPYEQRVTVFPLDRFMDFSHLPREMMPLANQFTSLKNIYVYEWTQHLFPYFNIQSLDMVQEPRVGADKIAYEAALSAAPALRRWELTNTRYLLGPSALLGTLNQQLDPIKKRFRIAAQFDLVPKAGVLSAMRFEQITTVINTNGQYALFEFAGGLPRARLFTNWQVSTNDTAALQNWLQSIQQRLPPEYFAPLSQLGTNDLATLKDLTQPAFEPAQTLMIAAGGAPPMANSGTNQNAGTVEFASYAPKRIVLRAKPVSPAVLLLDDRYDPNWKVTVDGKPAPLLRCNFIAQGVHLAAGEHTVEFRFAPPVHGLYVSLAAIGVAVLLLGYLAFSARNPVANSQSTDKAKNAGS